MIAGRTGPRVYIALGATDMRKSINGVSVLVEEQFELDLFSGSLFAFCNRKRNMVKILYWGGSGFCIWLQRLEADIFRWPDSQEEVMEISRTALEWILHCLDLRDDHQLLSYSSVS